MSLITVHVYQDSDELLRLLKETNKTLHNMANSIADLNAKADALQVALDQEQEQIAAAISKLENTVSDLKALVAEGGTAEERQALADKFDVITADLKGTIADDETPAPEPAPEPAPGE